MDLINKPRSKSTVWMYFGLKADEKGRPLNSGEAICRLCRKIVLAKGGNTTNLRSHLKRRHFADFYEAASSTSSGTFPECQGFDFSQEEFIEDIPSLQNTPNQNYVPDAVLPSGEPWLQAGSSRAVLSLPSCLRLLKEPGSDPRSSSEDRTGEIKVYAKYDLQHGLMFGPFVGEVVRGQLQTSLKYAWAIREEATFFYIDASNENKSNWMRYVTYASSEEEHNLVVFQFYRHIYYRVSQPIPEGTELKVWIGKDYAALLGLGMGTGESMKCEVGDKDMILRIFQDIQVITLPEPNSSSLWSDNSQSQSPMPVISDVTTMSNPVMIDGDSGLVSASGSNSSSMTSFPSPATHQLEKYDFIPGTEKLLSYPNATRNGPWHFFGFEPDPTGRPLDMTTMVCKLCGEHVGCAAGAVDIQNHLTTKHHIRLRESARDFKERSLLTTGQRSQALTLSSGLAGTLPQVMTTQVTNSIANFLIRDLQPPSLVEGKGFKQLIHTLLPSYKELPSASLLVSLLKENHAKGKKSLAQMLRRKMRTGEDEDIFNYTAPIEPRRRGRPPGPWREVPHFVTLSVDVWFHKWQGDTEKYVTLWAHYIDTNFSFQNLALTTQKLAETGTGDYSLRAVEAQVTAMAQEWGISQPNLVLLGGEAWEKMRTGLTRSKKFRETAGSGPHPNSTTFLEKEDSVSPDELHGLEHGHSWSEGLPSIPCFFTAVRGCIEEVMSHPVISKTLSLFHGVVSTLLPLHTQNKGSSQQHIESLLQTMPRQERAQLRSWTHSRPSWNNLYTLLNTLIKHRNLICDMTKEIKAESLSTEDTTNPTASDSSTTDSSPSAGIMAPMRSEWRIVEELCLVLKPLDVACRTLAKEAFPRLSLIKPILTGLLSRHLIPRPGDSSTVLKEVKRMMRRNLASCYDNPMVNRALCVACSLDPQFHGLGFMEAKEQTATFDWLKKEAVRIVKEDKRQSQARMQSQNKRSPSPSSPESDIDFLRRSKRLKETPRMNFKDLDYVEDVEDESDTWEPDENEQADPVSQGGLSGMEFLLGDLFCSAPQSRQSSVEESVDMEMSVFRADKGASLGVEPLQWWRTKAGQFPLLATVAQAYLAAPAVAGSAAEDFVGEGGAANRKTASIPPESLDAILFLHHNHMLTTGQTVVQKDDKT